MFNKQRRESVALIQLKIDTSGPAPRVVSPDVLALMPGDRLLFVADVQPPPPVPPRVFVDLGTTLVALVKFNNPLDFEVNQLASGDFTLKLKPGPGGGAGDTN